MSGDYTVHTENKQISPANGSTVGIVIYTYTSRYIVVILIKKMKIGKF